MDREMDKSIDITYHLYLYMIIQMLNIFNYGVVKYISLYPFSVKYNQVIKPFVGIFRIFVGILRAYLTEHMYADVTKPLVGHTVLGFNMLLIRRVYFKAKHIIQHISHVINIYAPEIYCKSLVCKVEICRPTSLQVKLPARAHILCNKIWHPDCLSNIF